MEKIRKFFSWTALLSKAGVDREKTLHFSRLTSDHLRRFNIVPDGDKLRLKPGYMKRAAITSRLGKSKLWSSTTFNRHLKFLHEHIQKENEQSARTWVDAIFFRVLAMVSSEKKMILSLERRVPPTTLHPSSTTTLSGFVDYTAVIVDRELPEPNFPDLTFEELKVRMPWGFFVAEAKKTDELEKHLPQVIGEMYACTKHLKINTLRGALTNGHSWVFLIVTLNYDGNGAKYKYSVPIKFQKEGSLQAIKPWPDVLAGILLHWIKNSFVEIGSNDWFRNGPKNT
ncbi:hypothetical protein EDB86DRAFT_206823 [Lactarius hatsudake]|nr:hypothetical protein EDB86DRAFT_206823 [Lactarius hatsudake]